MTKITIAGRLGSGKSTIAKRLQEELDLPYHSTGSIQRKMAEKANLTTLELNKQSESDEKIDHTIDDSTKHLDETEDFFILDSRMAWHFVKRSFKLYLYVDSKVSAERVFKDKSRTSEDYQSVDEALKFILEREQSEIRRFQQLYDVDITNFGNYDAVIDTSFAGVEELTALILALYSQWQNDGVCKNPVWLSPKLIYPTQILKDHHTAHDEIGDDTALVDLVRYPNPVSVIRHGWEFYIYERHQQAVQLIQHGFPVIPCVFSVAKSGGVSQRDKEQFVALQCNLDILKRWEKELKIKFHSYPTFKTT
jgi:cytidylate kinase